MTNEKRKFKGPFDFGSICGPIWIIGWLFTIGYVHLAFAKGLLALLIWPYYLGRALGAI